MKVLVTGSAGHLGEALMRALPAHGHAVRGIDLKPSDHTDAVGSITDAAWVARQVAGADVVLHTATLHKPHVATHSRRDFVDVNVGGTLHLLEAARAGGVSAFVLTSTTSTFGDAMRSAPGEPAVWVEESLACRPRNIYGATKVAAEELCRSFHREEGLPCVVLRTSRFFPEEDDDRVRRASFADDNLKVVELLSRRVDIADVVEAHRLAMARASEIGFDRFVVSATTPFLPVDVDQLGRDPAAVVSRRVFGCEVELERRGWRLPERLDRVYDNARARAVLGWRPAIDFAEALRRLARGEDYRSDLARAVGSKGYHDEVFADGPYPVVD